MSDASSNLAGYRLRGWLLLALCPLVAAIAYMVFAIKEPRLGAGITLTGSNATWNDLRFDEKRYFRLDYDSATVNELTEFERQSVQKNSKGELVFFRDRRNGKEQRSLSVLEVIDPSTRAVKRSIELPNKPTIIAGRFAVTASKGTVYSADLDAAKLELKSLSAKSSVEWISDVKHDRFFCTIAAQQNPSMNTLEVYKIADDASPLLVHSFPIFGFAVSVHRGVIKLLSSDRAFFEVRELSTGKLISSTPMPTEYVNGSPPIEIMSGYLSINTATGPRLFDPVRNIKLEHRVPADNFASDTNEEWERTVVAYFVGSMKRARIDVFDLATGRVNFTMQTTLPIENSLNLRIANRDTLIVQHTQNGLTIDFFDIRTGRLIRRISPYAWGTWALPLLFATLAVWAAAWLRASAYENGWAWMDVCLLAVLAIVPLVIRLLSIHMPSDVSRLPFSFSQGIVAGLANVCALWMSTGRTRFTLRILPFLGCMALLIVMLNLVFALTWYDSRSMLNISMLYLCKTALPAIGCYFVYLSLRWFGWSTYNLKYKAIEKEPVSRGVPMRDYFLLTAVLAVLVSVSCNLHPGLPELFQNTMSFPDFLISVVSFTGIALLTFSKFRIAKITSQVVALISVVVVIGYPIAEFNLGISRMLLMTQPQAILLVTATGTLSTFVFLQAYRQRGWRLGRTRLPSR